MAIIKHEEHSALAVNGGIRVKAARIGAGLTIEQLVEISGIDAGRIGRIEAGIVPASGPIVLVLADALSVSCDYLYGLADDPFPDHLTLHAASMKRDIQDANQASMDAIVDQLADGITASAERHRRYRATKRALRASASQLIDSYESMRKRNPQWDEDVRGGAALDKAVNGLAALIAGWNL